MGVNYKGTKTAFQAWDDDLDDIAALTPSLGAVMIGDGTNWTADTTPTLQGVLTTKNINLADNKLFLNTSSTYLQEEASNAGLLVFKTGTDRIKLRFGNNNGSPEIFGFQSGHVEVIPGGNLDIYYFEDVLEGENPEARFYGFPTGGASGYMQFQTVGTGSDGQITTSVVGSDLLLSPDRNVVCADTLLAHTNVDVIKYAAMRS